MVNKTLSGIKWSVIISIISTLSYLAINFLLAKIDDTSYLLGQFAAVIIVFNLIMTFVFFGSSNTIIHFYHKLKRDTKIYFLKIHLIFLFFISILTTLFFLMFPEVLEMINTLYGILTVVIITPLILYFFISSYEMARMNYKKGIVLDKVYHVLFLLITLGIAGVSYAGIEIKNIFDIFLFGLLSLTLFFIFKYKKLFVFLLKSTREDISKLDKKEYYKYTLLTQANAILAFLFMYLDQLIIGQKIGIEYMGIFFFFSQIALMVKYISMQFNKTLLSSFSSIVAKGSHEGLNSLYFLLFKNIILVSLTSSLFIYFFANELLVFINPNYLEYINILYLLTIASLIGSLGSINSMLIVSLNKLTSFLILNSLIGVLNIVLILNIESNFLENFALIKVIVVVFGQIGLFYLVRKNIDFDFKKISLLAIVLVSSILIYLQPDINIYLKLVLFTLISLMLFKEIKKDFITTKARG
jgi:O-antigen/teichoic acid export membrane protein